jgi:hypothetical protein
MTSDLGASFFAESELPLVNKALDLPFKECR